MTGPLKQIVFGMFDHLECRFPNPVLELIAGESFVRVGEVLRRTFSLHTSLPPRSMPVVEKFHLQAAGWA